MRWFKFQVHCKCSTNVVIIWKGFLIEGKIICLCSNFYLSMTIIQQSVGGRVLGLSGQRFRCMELCVLCILTQWLQTLTMSCLCALGLLLHMLKVIYRACLWLLVQEDGACFAFLTGQLCLQPQTGKIWWCIHTPASLPLVGLWFCGISTMKSIVTQRTEFLALSGNQLNNIFFLSFFLFSISLLHFPKSMLSDHVPK